MENKVQAVRRKGRGARDFSLSSPMILEPNVFPIAKSHQKDLMNFFKIILMAGRMRLLNQVESRGKSRLSLSCLKVTWGFLVFKPSSPNWVMRGGLLGLKEVLRNQMLVEEYKSRISLVWERRSNVHEPKKSTNPWLKLPMIHLQVSLSPRLDISSNA